MNFDTTFPHEYDWEVLRELPPNATPFCFSGGGSLAAGSGSILKCVPTRGADWIAIFSPGRDYRRAANGIFATSDAQSCCVVANGIAYSGQAGEPTSWAPLGIYPVVEVVAAPIANLVLLITPWSIGALSGAELIWTTRRLGLEGLKINEIDATQIRGEAVVEQDGIPFSIRTHDGVSIGGFGDPTSS